MSPPTWAVGQVLTASDVNTWFVPRVAYKTSAQHSTTTTLANDTQLALPVDANAIYDWDLFLFYDGGTLGSGDLQFNFTFPTGLTAAFQILGYNAASNDVERLGWQLPLGSNTIIGTEGLGNLRAATITGTVDTAAAAGTLQLQWARSSNASGVDTIVHVGSRMRLSRTG